MGEISVKNLDGMLRKHTMVEYGNKKFKIFEMKMFDYLRHLNGDFDGASNQDSLEATIELLSTCVRGFVFDIDREDMIQEILFLYHALVLFHKDLPKNEVITSQISSDGNKDDSEDYDLIINYNYILARIIRGYHMSLDEVMALSRSQFLSLNESLQILEAEEDLRLSKVVDNKIFLKGKDTKDVYKEFRKSLTDRIKRGINSIITDEGNIRQLDKGLGALKSHLGGRVK